MASSHVQNVSHCPFMVSLKQTVNGQVRLCGGTVLTATLTLTAAHCLVFGISELTLRFGSINLFKNGVQHWATNVILHEDFDRETLENDIGVVSIFPHWLPFDTYVQPVKLPIGIKEISLDFQVTIYGWGAISDDVSFSTYLRKAQLPLVNKNICQILLEERVPENTLCLGYIDGHIDACTGDSGGPAMLGDVQIGITSFGEGCAQPLKPGVYTDLTKYTHWLEDIKRMAK